MKENAGVPYNSSSRSSFELKESSTRTREHQVLLALHEDLPSSVSDSAASSERSHQELTTVLSMQPHHDQLHAHSDHSPSGSHDFAASLVLACGPPLADMLHMHANDSRAPVLNLQVPPSSLLQLSRTSAIRTLQGFFIINELILRICLFRLIKEQHI
jgi:hypothetical protein